MKHPSSPAVLLLAACGSGSAEPVDPPPDGGGVDLSSLPADGGRIGPGDPCPSGTGCTGGLHCLFVPPVNKLLCSVWCGSFADCRATGFADGCCEWALGPMGLPACVPERLGVCAHLREGEVCNWGGQCAEGLVCDQPPGESARRQCVAE